MKDGTERDDGDGDGFEEWCGQAKPYRSLREDGDRQKYGGRESEKGRFAKEEVELGTFHVLFTRTEERTEGGEDPAWGDTED
jgi:hypothetical protein